MASKTAFDMDDSLGRIDTLSIVPPQTLASFRSQVMKAEGLVNQKIQLFEDMDGEVPMNDNDAHISFQTQVYPGHDKDHPITIVCGQPSRGEINEARKTNQMDETAAPAEAEAATEAPTATEEVKEEKVCVPAPITHYVPLTPVAEGGEKGD